MCPKFIDDSFYKNLGYLNDQVLPTVVGILLCSINIVDNETMLARRFFCGICYISATKEPAQPCDLVSGLQSWSASI